MEVSGLSQTQAKASKKLDAITQEQSDEKEPSSPVDDKSRESLLAGALNSLEKRAERFDELHQCTHGKELFCALEKAATGLIGMHKEITGWQQESLHRWRVLSGSYDYVEMFRYAVFRDVCLHDKEVAEKYTTFDSYLSATMDEYRAWRLERGRARPLHDKWAASVQQLGLSLDEWRLLRELGAKSVSGFGNQLSLAELEDSPFPASFEMYRMPLLKAAKKLKELGFEVEKRSFKSLI